MLTSDANERGSFLKDMAKNITELCFDDLDAPPVVVGARNWIIPAHELEDFYFPQAEWIVDAVHEKILPLKGQSVTNDFSDDKKIWRAAGGI